MIKEIATRVKNHVSQQWIRYALILIMLIVSLARNVANIREYHSPRVELTEEQILRTEQRKQERLIQYVVVIGLLVGVFLVVRVLNSRQEAKDKKN